MYANTHLLPLLTRIWSVPDDLPHAAGMGNLARVKQWFDSAGVVRNLAEGWARYGNNDEQMAQWLEEAERRRGRGAR